MPKGVDINFAKKLAAKLMLWTKKHDIAVVVGGGALSREFDKIGRKITKDEDYLDLLGIYASRLNAALLIAALVTLPAPLSRAQKLSFWICF